MDGAVANTAAQRRYVVAPTLMSQMEARGAVLGRGGDPVTARMGTLLRDFAVQVSLAEQAPHVGLPSPGMAIPERVPATGPTEDSQDASAGNTRGSGQSCGGADVDAIGGPGPDVLPLDSRSELSLGQPPIEVLFGPAASSSFPSAAVESSVGAGSSFDLSAESVAALLVPPAVGDEDPADGKDAEGDLGIQPLEADTPCAGDKVPRALRRPSPSNEAEKLAREEGRRERNKAAAARANARRKQRNDRLKD